MKYQKNCWFFLAAFLGIAAFVGCVKTTFDEPPVDEQLVTVTANKTIKELKALHITSGGYDPIKDDIIISGDVIMDDKSGNYYKTIVIQDASGGIEVKFDNGFLFTRYPIGRKIFIRCKDLLLTDYNGVTQLIGSLVEAAGVFESFGLTEIQERQKIVKGGFSEGPITPKLVTIRDLNKDMISTLIRLDNVQFIAADTARTWAEPVTQNSLNRKLEECTGTKTLLVRTSGFADFAAAKTPTKLGSVTGVLGIYGTDYQLYLRDLNDVKADSSRCRAGGTTGNEASINISDVRSLFTGTTAFAPAAKKIKGIVISDRAGKNLNAQNIYLQDGTAGILVRFTATHSFNLGDELEVVVSNMELSEFNKLLQVNNVPLVNAKVIRTGQSVTPKEMTVADLNTNFNSLESTLVRIKNATITGGTTLSGSRTVGDGTGTIVMFTQTASTFSGTATPSGAVTITAIVSDFNGKQIILRNAADIQQ